MSARRRTGLFPIGGLRCHGSWRWDPILSNQPYFIQQIQDAEEFFKSPEGAKFVKKKETDEEKGLEMEAKDEEKDAAKEEAKDAAKEEGEEMEETGAIAEGWLKAKKYLCFHMISMQYEQILQ